MKQTVEAKLYLERVEVRKTKFDKRGRPVEEQIEFYLPIDQELSPLTIGFDLSKTKSKKSPK